MQDGATSHSHFYPFYHFYPTGGVTGGGVGVWG